MILLTIYLLIIEIILRTLLKYLKLENANAIH